ncbi:hypothetical protein B566_EDAN016868 [Ephemera danica]|nr:hypothetical protein B566_EDAN016868 [Ephemera danica]
MVFHSIAASWLLCQYCENFSSNLVKLIKIYGKYYFICRFSSNDTTTKMLKSIFKVDLFFNLYTLKSVMHVSRII